MRRLGVYASAAAVLALLSTDKAGAGTATGCLKKNGQLMLLAVGDEPRRACPRNASQVALGLQEPDRLLTFHEVLLFGEDLHIRDADQERDQYEVFAMCRENGNHRVAELMVEQRHGSMIIVNGGETKISGSAEDASFSTGYTTPHMYDMAARSATVEYMTFDGDRVRVEATIVVNHVECIISGTVELFAREDG